MSWQDNYVRNTWKKNRSGSGLFYGTIPTYDWNEKVN